MKQIIIFFFLASFILLAPPAYSAETDPVITKMQSVYKEMNSFSADFTQELIHRESQTTQNRSGKLFFQKPFLVKWDTQLPNPELLMVTNKEIWNYLPDEELAYKYSLELAQDSRSIVAVITGQSSLEKDFEIEKMENEKREGKNLAHFLLYPLEPTTELTEAEIWIDIETSLIHTLSILDFYGNSNEVTLKNFAKNPKLAKNTFDFTPPKGIEIEDHTNLNNITTQNLND